MKKILIVVIIIFIIMLVTIAVIFYKNGDISNVNIILKESEIYSNEDINSAVDIALKYFKKNFKGCSLLEIGYIGDEINNNYSNYAKINNKEEVIVLTSSFNVDSSGGENGELNPNSKYDDWNWILVRNENENWEHVDHGYY